MYVVGVEWRQVAAASEAARRRLAFKLKVNIVRAAGEEEEEDGIEEEAGKVFPNLLRLQLLKELDAVLA